MMSSRLGFEVKSALATALTHGAEVTHEQSGASAVDRIRPQARGAQGREAGEEAAPQETGADAGGARGCARQSHQRGDAIRLAAAWRLSLPRSNARRRRARNRMSILIRRERGHSPTCSSQG